MRVRGTFKENGQKKKFYTWNKQEISVTHNEEKRIRKIDTHRIYGKQEGQRATVINLPKENF